MALFTAEIGLFLKHLLGTYIAAIVILAAAIGLAFVEKWCEAHQMPGYLSYGVTSISVTLLTFDGVVVCGTTAIVALRLLQKTWKHEY
jgi:Na+/H+ antiporter NhaC